MSESKPPPHPSIYTEIATGLRGQIMLAMPGMDDTRFERSVIYMTEHDENGAMGFVLNKRNKENMLHDILVKMPAVLANSTAADLPVYDGGPIKGETGYLIYNERDKDELVVSTSLGFLVNAIKKDVAPLPPMRLLLGYAGWTAGQLETELEQNIWLTLPCKADAILHVPHEQLYDHCVASLGFNLSALSHISGQA